MRTATQEGWAPARRSLEDATGNPVFEAGTGVPPWGDWWTLSPNQGLPQSKLVFSQDLGARHGGRGMSLRWPLLLAFAGLLLPLLWSCSATALATPSAAPTASGSWGDGRAEVAGYRLRIPRYGQVRQGEATLIFVTEDMTHGQRVKTDGGHEDVYPVPKLNQLLSFQTGIYDYSSMTSSFVSRWWPGPGPGHQGQRLRPGVVRAHLGAAARG